MAPEQGAFPAGRKVIIDAGAAIKLQRLERFGGSLWTTSGVLNEVRDENARALLRTLPEEIRVREPLPQDVAYAKNFAKATGDFGFLSQNDLNLIALTVTMHRESGGKLRDRPSALASGEGNVGFDWAPAKAADEASKDTPASASTAAASGGARTASTSGGDFRSLPPSAWASIHRLFGIESMREAPRAVASTSSLPADAPATAKPSAETTEAEADLSDKDSWDDDDEDGDSAGEWVTPDNMHRFGTNVKSGADLLVTCVSTDYSVQNVLLQMGITPLTFDGYAVTSVKLWGLVCRACFHFCRDTEKVFCPKCGNDTVIRVPIIVDQAGQPTVLHTGRPLRKKGTVFSVPKPQGGRGWKPVFAEDEMRMGGRDRELRHAQNVSQKERASRDPFNEDNAAKGWWQRSSGGGGRPLGAGMPRVQAGYGRRTNPNANNFKGFAGNRKRR
eukprot:TRINITY_DN31396_c0_g1_i1.p1 TRINITY_DN31396_c0_g1~~TRINITY_DN31396_c0_g1_i1.p1  ORF type:complete len:446 (-),score=95.63 TRINITY_DN31396_c0_g1_i1:119-1456(-)